MVAQPKEKREMARYISKAAAFKKSLRKPAVETVKTPSGPRQVETTKPIIAHFGQGATAGEVGLAVARFGFKDAGPESRLSVFDTDEQAKALGWTVEDKAEFEAVLDAGQGEFYFKVENEPAAKPWENYDETPAGQVVKTAALIGCDLRVVLAYERENKNRKTVVAELEGAGGEIVVAA